jgi:hypothetical protein
VPGSDNYLPKSVRKPDSYVLRYMVFSSSLTYRIESRMVALHHPQADSRWNIDGDFIGFAKLVSLMRNSLSSSSGSLLARR